MKDQSAKVSELQRRLLSTPDPATARLEHEERAKWNTLKRAEEKFYRQKSRVRWHHLGDRDTPFFHKCVVQRAANNHIYFLRDTDNMLISSAEEIKTHATDYFKGILGQTDLQESPCTVAELQDLLPFHCSDAHCQVLTRPVSADEITKTSFLCL